MDDFNLERSTRLAIFISGRGSNMKSLVKACRARDIPAQPVLIISNAYTSEGLEWAIEQKLPIAVLDHTGYSDRSGFENAIQEALDIHDVEFIALAGFMRILTAEFVEKWAGRMINIHPSLLPKYPGLNTHKRALDAGDTEAGCTVHWVTEGVDEGGIIDQETVPIIDGDTPDTLAARVLEKEHTLYPRALNSALEDYKASTTS